MDFNLIIKQMEETLLPHLKEEQVKSDFLKQIKRLKREFRGSEFKLKRTIQDKQITTNVLENTITELKIQSENLKHQKALTEEQAAFKEQLFANVSHELRTPLHGILGMSHLLENTQLEDNQKGFVEIIRSSADNLLVIINDLLNLSKINAGKTILIKEPFSVNKFLIDLQGVLTFKAQEKGLKFTIQKATNIPNYLVGDRTRLYQVLLNLLNNAIKYTEKGYVELHVNLLQKNEDEITLEFKVSDSGIGIEKEKLNSIFDSFTQLEIGKGKIYEGVGLGLNIVKKLVDLMKGNIKVESSSKGSIFIVNLTFNIPASELNSNLHTEKSLLAFPENWQEKKILMIEDNEANLIYAENLFASGNIPLELAETLAVAREKIKHQIYDCILSDVKLPDGNGLDFIAELRADNSAINQETPIIVLTASANEKEATYAKKLNIQSYIGKPFPPQILISEMKKVFVHQNGNPQLQILSIKPKQSINANESYFAHLEKNFKGKPRLQIEMFDIFLDQLPQALKQMEFGLTNNDLKVFHYDAHRIKSTINIIGLPKLKPLISKMDEFSYKKTNLEQLPALYDQFKEQAAKDILLIQARKAELTVVT